MTPLGAVEGQRTKLKDKHLLLPFLLKPQLLSICYSNFLFEILLHIQKIIPPMAK